MDSHHHDIIRLAWSRRLGLDDSALRPGSRHIAITPDETSVTFVRLGDSSVLIGPERGVESANKYTDGELAARGRPGHDHSVLHFAGDISTTIARHDPLISHELAHVLALETLCAPDEVAVADLTRRRSWFTLLDDDRPADSAAPLSCAAYLEWEGVLADVGVLTAPGARRHGNAQVVGRLVTNDAFDEGMIPQWRTSSENGTARRLAARLGYQEWGVQVSIDVDT
ncbi:GNAT family N-acetyltransferase [Rhodococcus sp. G-MC3]|uniref:GNAT family N-acetyltransferase n=1 Tax=Rhodococcus sp. G-MC3 TaxID=3046209 RepID=UPI0024B8D02E|nr:GNAT family N-acetyltransferase [Rhodococcus sp. G-MC3]MDJ0392384.1 GNAT family N-acetyltransferase [Rhodococcus sp. G-MC3]